MKKKLLGIVGGAVFAAFFLSAAVALADGDPIKVTIDSLTNIGRDSGAMEVCGTAVHKDGIKPLLVTVKHDESFYSVLTAPNDKWCTVVKRWTFDGKVDAGATTLTSPGSFELRTYAVGQARK